METRPRQLNFSDQQQSVNSNELRPILAHSRLQQVGDGVEEVEAEPNIELKYYQEFKKIYLTSFKLWAEIHKQLHIKDALLIKIAQIENQLVALHKTKRPEPPEQEQEDPETSQKRRANKRTRRTAEEIERKYYCEAQYCDRCYGSDGSLQQHIKLKHPEMYRGKDDSREL